MKITNQVVKNIITRVIQSQDYRIEIVNLLNAEFLQFSIDFFKRIVDAKMSAKTIDMEWYKQNFLAENLPSNDIIIHSGLNKKTISNMYGSARKSIVIEASNEHFDTLYNSICHLVENEQEKVDLTLTIKFQGVSVDLSISESLIVINTLAVKRAELRGGLWSTAGKRVEKYLVLTLCHLFQIPSEYYDSSNFVKDREKNVDREVDFYFIKENKKYLCEVKLMGKGNPESADAIFARNTNIFIADTLSEQNKNQCNQLGIYWITLREPNGYLKFEQILRDLSIPYTKYKGYLQDDLNKILDLLLD
ncbi:CfrBI family restriction endonuclease [Conservatibacter flavescens]|uniref:CfrBI family restriction endonuclease n=1 Tax=Conservatibacter flavescens TaxID=28161 RepID=A0A2M8S3A0_9PAST|nr:CfrBI family restriction endonuclease [Conservatibacter flavescens]PJG85629.1 CfrBI family restriction endonuclease [Conservatibacter flavescens]